MKTGWAPRWLVVAVVVWVPACGTHRSPSTPVSSQSEPHHSEVSTTIVTSKEAIDVRELLLRAQLALSEERYAEATRDFQLASEGAQNNEERFLALRGWGTTRDILGDPEEALQLYLRADELGSDGPLRDGLKVRIVRLLVYLERYEEGSSLAEGITRGDLSPLEQIALHAALALGRIQRGDLSRAERSVSEGRAIVDERGLDRVEISPLDLAALFFAQGELHRLQAEEIEFDPLPPDFLDRLEARCQLILDAQGAFSQAMRSQDAHWSSMSGVRVGELYKELHTDLMNLPVPPEANSPERRLLFEGAMRLRYSVLLRKAVSMMRATVALLDRNERQSPWRKKAQDALDEIEETQRAEEMAIDALPYTRAELEAALQSLAARAKSPSGGS